MIQIPPDAVEEALIVFVRQWFKLLAVGKSQEACSMIDEANCYGMTWTPERLQQAVEDAFGAGCRFRAQHPEGLRWSDPDELGNGGHPEFYGLAGASVYAFEHDVPLNGEWSDLTAQFRFHRRPQGFAVVLHDLHVL